MGGRERAGGGQPAGARMCAHGAQEIRLARRASKTMCCLKHNVHVLRNTHAAVFSEGGGSGP